jgi:hypothetical protein
MLHSFFLFWQGFGFLFFSISTFEGTVSFPLKKVNKESPAALAANEISFAYFSL